jgi:tape measure domain-containing protein
MPTADEVIVEFEARVGKYEADLRRSAATFERVTQAQQRQMVALERQISMSSGRIGSAFKSLAGLFGAQQVIGLSDSYTRLQNSLKVAGLEGEALAETQAKLLDLGGKYGVSVNTLADLYGNLAQVSGELGASQSQLMTINEAVAQSLIVTGKSSQEASGAVLGLVQAFGNGKLQAEEWAQINEGGLRPLLEAAAASEKYAGSVQKLRKAVYDGKVSSQEFFQAILAGASVIEGKAANATLTLEGAYTSLNNRLIEFVGSAASTSGAAGAIASGLQALSNNLETVSNALAVITTVMGVRYVAAAGASVIATTAKNAAEVRALLTTRALTGATYQANAAILGEASAARIATASVSGLAVAQGVAARAGAVLLGAVGGPIGAAVLALGAGILYLSTRTDEAATASGEYAKAQDRLAKIQDKSAAAASNVAIATGKARVEALANAKALQQETQQYIANAKAAAAAARAKASQAAQDARIIAASSGAQSVSTGSAMIVGGNIVGQRTDTANRQAQTNLRVAEENLKKAEEELKRINATVDGLTAPRVVTPAADDPKKKPKSKADKPDPLAADRELAQLRIEELQARLDLATTAEARADLQRKILAEERAQRVAEIAANKDLSDKQRKAALDAIDRLYGAQGENGDIVVAPGRYDQRVSRDLEREQAQRAQDIADERFRAEQEILRNQYDLADSSAERKRLALASIDLDERYQRAQLQAIIDLEGANSAEGQRAQAGLDSLGEISDGRRKVAERSNQSPLEAYRDRLNRDGNETSDMVEGYVVDELQHVRDSIRGGIEKQLGIKDPLISGLLNMLIEDVLIKPITDALSEASKDGSGAGGLLQSLGAAASKIFGGGRAIGGPVQAGTPYMVGESGREMFVPQQSGVIVPNHRLSGRSAGQQTVINYIGPGAEEFWGSVDARSARVAAPIARTESSRSGAASYAQGQKSAPGTMYKYSQLKG